MCVETCGETCGEKCVEDCVETCAGRDIWRDMCLDMYLDMCIRHVYETCVQTSAYACVLRCAFEMRIRQCTVDIGMRIRQCAADRSRVGGAEILDSKPMDLDVVAKTSTSATPLGCAWSSGAPNLCGDTCRNVFLAACVWGCA